MDWDSDDPVSESEIRMWVSLIMSAIAGVGAGVVFMNGWNPSVWILLFLITMSLAVAESGDGYNRRLWEWVCEVLD